MQARIIFFASNPPDTPRLAIDQEFKNLRECRDRSPLRDHIALEFVPWVRGDQLAREISQFGPTVIHVTAHGDEDSALILHDDRGNGLRAPPEALTRLLEAVTREERPRCVVLNACHSSALAERLADCVECVIGAPAALGEATALKYARAFYDEALSGVDVEAAHERACEAVRLSIPSPGALPVLHRRGGGPPVILVTAEAGGRAARAASPLPRLQHFLGRDAERDALVAFAVEPECTAINIYGAPGAGKSTLALAVASDARVAERFGDRRWFVRLDGVTAASSIWGAVREAMGLQVRPAPRRGDDFTPLGAAGDPAREAVTRKLDGGGVVILDNCETPWDADPVGTAQVLRALGSMRDVALIVTVRGRLVLPIDVRWREHHVGALPREASRSLMLEVAGVDDDPALEEALDALADHALAVVLFAGVVRHVGSAEALRRWRDHRLAVLSAGPGALEERHASWIAVIDTVLASRRLGEAARRLARWVADLPSGVHRDDLTDLGGPGAQEAAAEIVAAGLAGWGSAPSERLRMLAPVAEALRLRVSLDAEDAARVYGRCLAIVVQSGERPGGGRPSIDPLVARELANIEASLRWHVEAEHREAVAPAVTALACHYLATGSGDFVWLESCLRRDPAPRRKAWADALLLVARLATASGSTGEGRSMYEEARDLFRELAEPRGQVLCLLGLGDVELVEYRYGDALGLYREALDLAAEDGGSDCQAEAALAAASAEQRAGVHDSAERYLEEARRLFDESGDEFGEATAAMRLAGLAHRRDHPEGAKALLERARSVFLECGEGLSEAECVRALGDVARYQGRPTDAGRMYEEALKAFRRLQNTTGIGNCFWGLALVALMTGDRVQARAHLTTALAAHQSTGNLLGIADAYAELAVLSRGAERAEFVLAAERAYRLANRSGLILGLANRLPARPTWEDVVNPGRLLGMLVAGVLLSFGSLVLVVVVLETSARRRPRANAPTESMDATSTDLPSVEPRREHLTPGTRPRRSTQIDHVHPLLDSRDGGRPPTPRTPSSRPRR